MLPYFLGASIETSQTYHSILTHWNSAIKFQYASHLWRGASEHSLATLDAIQKRAIKLMGDPALTNSLDSPANRRTISALSLCYRYFHGVCSVELKSIILPKELAKALVRFLSNLTAKGC